MPNYKNQKTIILNNQDLITHKEGDGKSFLRATNWEYLETAGRQLSGNGFKVYMYLLSWYGKGEVFFSPVAVCKKWGVSEQGARDAIKELIKLGFLEATEKPTIFNFYPIARNAV